MGRYYWETGQYQNDQAAPFQNAYAVRANQDDSAGGSVFLPFDPDGGPDTYTLYLGWWSTEGAAAGADYALEFHRGTDQVLPLLCEMMEEVRLDALSGDRALAFLQMALPQYLFDENAWS